MTTGVDFVVEGLTTIVSCADGSFRYVISVKNEQINIWLEERFSKKQWQSGFLSKEVYVTAANIFVDASPADYTACFKQCLDCLPVLDQTGDSQRKLTVLRGGKLQLELSIKLRLLQSVREVHYVFKLEPVPVERIDILESKLKDQQEELEMLRGQVGTAKHVFLSAESVTWSSQTWSSQKLEWKITSGEKFSLAANNTAIKVFCPGLYAISVLANHHPTTATGWISLEKSGAQIQRAAIGESNYCDSYSGVQKLATHNTGSSLMCIVQVKKDEPITVVCSGNSVIANTASYLTAVRIGT
ncbi:hypothetical protein V7S43_010753 [Phytophthora oleae]|uniref:Uncharacterized protein n=1 Tax=Phytophthora oleae TaxID=2107226 RepID=A0ABD3FET9_9STRA